MSAQNEKGAVSEMRTRAYQQGREAALAGRAISQADWEAEFLADYNRGYEAGRAVLAAAESTP